MTTQHSKGIALRKPLAEFIGALFLVFTITATVLSKASLAPLAIGASLMVMVYAGGHVSGAHFNPAVTLGVFVRGGIKGGEAMAYVVAQVTGGLVGGLIGRWVVDPDEVTAVSLSGRQIGAALVAEALLTFMLAYVVLNVATSSDHPQNSFYGLAIGFTVLAGAVAVGGVSGGVFNPAVAMGGSVAGLFSWSSLWVYLIAQGVGGTLAGFAFLALNPDERGTPRAEPDTAVPDVDAPGTGATART
ncbi:MIP/aquaporin family protein [Streptomyces sp. GMR22]|uniref:MIP/aquaporin family protein n=1 Tax=Streptomyces sp. GMR22 TaxID=2759524 RepID=UPI001F46EF08|nr:aquaporin [Streptomyces sp. GMR22]